MELNIGIPKFVKSTASAVWNLSPKSAISSVKKATRKLPRLKIERGPDAKVKTEKQ